MKAIMAAGSKGKNRGLEIHYYSKVTQEHFATEGEHQFTHIKTTYLPKAFLYEAVTSHSASKLEHLDTKDIVS